MGFDQFLTKVFGSSNQRYLKSIQPIVDQINDLEPAIQKQSDEQLRARTAADLFHLSRAFGRVDWSFGAGLGNWSAYGARGGLWGSRLRRCCGILKC